MTTVAQTATYQKKLADLLQYILMGQKNGPPPTRNGFNAWRKTRGLTPAHHTFFTAAIALQVIKQGTTRTSKGWLLETGDRAPEFYHLIAPTYRKLLGV